MARDVVRFARSTEVVQIVPDLVGDAQRPAVGPEHLVTFFVLAGVDGSQSKGDFKGRGCLLTEDVDHLERGQDSGFAGPHELGTLTAAQLALPFGRHAHHFGLGLGAGLAGGQEAVALTDEQVADIEGNSHTVFFVQRLLAVAEAVVVLDVVVDERGFVEAFHRDGDLA